MLLDLGETGLLSWVRVLVTPYPVPVLLVTVPGFFYLLDSRPFLIRSFACALRLPCSLVKSSYSSGSWLRLILIVSLITFSRSQLVLLG